HDREPTARVLPRIVVPASLAVDGLEDLLDPLVAEREPDEQRRIVPHQVHLWTQGRRIGVRGLLLPFVVASGEHHAAAQATLAKPLATLLVRLVKRWERHVAVNVEDRNLPEVLRAGVDGGDRF